MTITAKALPAFSVIAGLVTILAILTPGWFGLDIKSGENAITMSMNVFYAVVCVTGKVNMCTTVSVAEAVAQQKFGTEVSERLIERIVEAVGCLIGVVIGGIMTLVFATSVNRQEITPSKQVAITALIFKIIGGICGGILTTEFIVANVNFHDGVVKVDEETITLVKSLPYSLIVIGIGLFLELIAIVLHIAMLIKSCRQVPESGMVNSPSVNGPGIVIAQNTSTMSTTQYTRLA